MTTKPSNLWKNITSTLFQNIDDDFVNSFRIPGTPPNARLAAWDPYDKSMRYFKFLLYNTARGKNLEFFKAYKKIKNVNVGQPASVYVGGCNINIDHLFAVEEVLFMRGALKSEIKSVVEIGAGFGRTCQALLCIEPRIEVYTIIDLPEVLNLSKLYLKKVMPDLIGKVEFIDCTSGIFKERTADLAINIDSFQEMMPTTIDKYMKDVISNCHAFYCKNPTGKYSPDTVGLQNINPEQLKDVYALGYCREVFDLYNEEALNKAAQNYLSAYLPSPQKHATEGWELVADEAMVMFPYLHHALYRRS